MQHTGPYGLHGNSLLQRGRAGADLGSIPAAGRQDLLLQKIKITAAVQLPGVVILVHQGLPQCQAKHQQHGAQAAHRLRRDQQLRRQAALIGGTHATPRSVGPLMSLP